MEENSCWWGKAVIYEVYVNKFAGDFRSLAGKLDYLNRLGINCIWLLPHYPSPMIDEGYDVSDYFSVRKDLGTLDDFKSFVKKADEFGIKIIVDLVLNHVSTSHLWFSEAKKSADNPKRDFFLWSKTGREFSQARNPFSHMCSSNWIYSPETGYYYFASFFPEQADLNWDNPEVLKEIVKIIDFWASLGVDGFRLDAVGHLIKRDGTDCHHLPEVHGILKKIRQHLNENWPEVILLAEAAGSVEKVKQYFGTGDECHMVFNFPLMASMYLAIKRGDMDILADMVSQSFDIPENCQWATFLSNHDEITLQTLSESEREEILPWLDPEDKYSFKGGLGVAMRLASVFKGDRDKILNAFKVLLSLPGSPVIYYGSEIGMENIEIHPSPMDARKYVRGEFDWKKVDRQATDSESLLSQLSEIIGQKRYQLRQKPSIDYPPNSL